MALAAAPGRRDAQPRAGGPAPPAATVPTAEPTKADRAQRLVPERLGAVPRFSFEPAQVCTNEGATIVCGRYRLPGQPPRRYIAVGDEDIFVESQMQPGHMDQAATEFCRNA